MPQSIDPTDLGQMDTFWPDSYFSCAQVCDLVREDEGKTKKRSIGIISLYHKAQATLIDRLLDEDDYISKNREKHAIRCGDAREFQGEERDIILLSVVICAERFQGN